MMKSTMVLRGSFKGVSHVLKAATLLGDGKTPATSFSDYINSTCNKELLTALPWTACLACGQRYKGNPRQHPTAYCGLVPTGCPDTDPVK